MVTVLEFHCVAVGPNSLSMYMLLINISEDFLCFTRRYLILVLDVCIA